jgi:transcriptional regulator with XRE-family HTH domain
MCGLHSLLLLGSNFTKKFFGELLIIDQFGHVELDQMKTFGELIRELRESRRMLLREVAASLQIDPSLLSRIERGDKNPTRDQVIHLAKILKASENELLINYLSDKVVYELQGEELAIKAMSIAEKKIAYITNGKNAKH